MSIRAAASEARSSLGSAVDSLARGNTAGATTELRDARTAIDEALAGTRRIDARIARAFPVVGTEMKVVDAAVEAAADITSAVEVVASYLSSPHPPLYRAGQMDAGTAADLAQVWKEAAEKARRAQERMEAAPRPRLAQVTEAAQEVETRTGQAAVATGTIASLLQQVSQAAAGEQSLRVLFVVANGAELRAIGGVPVLLAELEVSDERLRLRELMPTSTAHPASAVPAPSDFEALFGPFDASRLWSNVTMSADGPTVGEVSAQMYEAVTSRPPDVVVVTDLVATGYMLEAFPRLEVEGEPLDPTTLATDFLIDSYQRFDSGEEQNRYLLGVVEDVFEQLLDGEPYGSGILDNLRRAVSEGRIVAWSPTPEIQAGFALAGAAHVSGDEEDEIHVAVQNFSASKLDLFTTINTDLQLETVGCALVGNLEVTITESTPAALVETLRFGADTNRWWVNVYLPPDSGVQELRVDEDLSRGGEGVWNGRPVVSLFLEGGLGSRVAGAVEWIQPIHDPTTMSIRTNQTVSEPAHETTVPTPSAGSCGPDNR